MTRPLPPKPSLEQLKKQAKDLLRAYRAQDSQAADRVRMHLVPCKSTNALTLASAMHILAREFGFATWPALKQQVVSIEQNQRSAEQVKQLGSRDWRVVVAADAELAQTGDAGLDMVLGGLSDPLPSVRRCCADFLSRHATDRCVPDLRHIALSDPTPSVRRVALRALGYPRCKAFRPGRNTVELLSNIALTDANMRVRRDAVSHLSLHPSDPRAVAPLRTILDAESDRMLLKLAHAALKHHDPEYREAVDSRAREQGVARAEPVSQERQKNGE